MQREHIQSNLKDYYLHQFGYGKDVQIRNFVHIQAGWESEIYAYDLLVGGEDPQELILRIYPGADALDKSQREFENLKRLVGLDFPVPRAYTLESDIALIGDPFVIMERIPGETLWGTLFSSKPEEQAELIDLFNQLYVQLHNLDTQPFLEDQENVIGNDSSSVVTSQFENWRAVYDRLPLPDFLPILDWLEDHIADLEKSYPAVLHWDFHPENIILQPDGSMVVIDWTGLQVSDLRFDLAWTLMLITAYEGGYWRTPFIESYERAAGESFPNMEFFDVAACTRRLFSIAGSISAGAEKLGMRPGAEETMRKQIEPARAVNKLLLKRTGIHLPSLENWLNG
jgi:aminoglycoside phosphotransferase (APT) family kinase protein